MPQPKVSVIVPAYNARHSIGFCLDALENQTYPRSETEVIVVDDGSTDGTSLLVKESYPNCRIIRQDNAGPASARNAGARHATGQILLFTDSDCVPESDWIEEMLKPFVDSAVSAVKGAYRTDSPELWARFSQVEFEERFEMLSKHEHIDMVDTYSAGYRSVAFREVGGFDSRFPVANNEDTELSYRLIEAGHQLVFNRQAIVKHLGHPNSMSKYGKVKFGRGYWRMMVYRMYPQKAIKDSYTPQMLKFQILLLFVMLLSSLASIITAEARYLVLFSAGGFLVSCVPFMRVAYRHDWRVLVLSPLLLAWRAFVIGAGAAAGLLGSKIPERSL